MIALLLEWRATLAGGVILALGLAPLGVLLIQRRLSMIGDAVAHGMLPGVAIAMIVAGAGAGALTLGGFAAGLGIAWLSGLLARSTGQGEETSLAAVYLGALALGLLLLGAAGLDAEEVGHVLFGAERPLGRDGLLLIGIATTATVVALAFVWPALVLDIADRAFLRSVSRSGPLAHATLLALVVAMLTASFQAVGTVLSVGLLVLPAAAARFCAEGLLARIVAAAAIGVVASLAGVLAAALFSVSPGPAIAFAAAALYGGAALCGPAGGALSRWLRPRQHYAG